MCGSFGSRGGGGGLPRSLCQLSPLTPPAWRLWSNNLALRVVHQLVVLRFGPRESAHAHYCSTGECVWARMHQCTGGSVGARTFSTIYLRSQVPAALATWDFSPTLPAPYRNSSSVAREVTHLCCRFRNRLPPPAAHRNPPPPHPKTHGTHTFSHLYSKI